MAHSLTTFRRSLLRLSSALVLLLADAGGVIADGINVRVTPPHRVQLLASQRFDIRVEATAADAGGTVTSLKVTVDGIDVTSRGVLTNAPGNVNWDFRTAAFGITGPRVIAATATGLSGSTATSGTSSSTLTVRPWDRSQIVASALGSSDSSLAGSFPDVEAAALAPLMRHRMEEDARERDPMANMDELHLGKISPLFHVVPNSPEAKAAGLVDIPIKKAKNVILFIGDGMGAAHRTAARVMAKGYTGGKANGIVSNALITDATPAAFLAHTQDRGDGTLIANQYFDLRNTNGLKVLLGGGSYHFIPKSTPGSRRTDERNVINDFKGDGWTYVDTATALNGFTPGLNGRLFGLFNLDNMNVAFDLLKQGDPAVVGAFTDQPFLKDMTQKAIDTLKQYPNGFFLMVESAHIDKQAHRMDAERSIYEVIQLDHAVQVALDFAAQNGETLVIVSADHECSGMALPAVSRPEKKGTHDYAKSYNYAAARNDSIVFNFTDYVIGSNGYPVSPEPAHKLLVNFGAAPEHYEDWTVSARPRNASATEGSGFEPAVVSAGTVVANPSDPKKSTAGSFIVSGVLENGANGGDVQLQAVHTMTDIPISAFGPGASQFARVLDNTEAFFEIMNSYLGTYPIPASF